MNMRIVSLFCLICLLLSGCLSAPVASVELTPEDPDALVGLYKLRALDPLTITFLGIPSEKRIETVIDEQGEIKLPYIDEPISAVEMTTSQLERKIQQIYTEGGIYKSITVNVQTTAKIYYMEGEVARPQEYMLNRRITVLQAIAAAGGYTDYADPKDVTITRRGEIIKLNAKKLEKRPELDIPVEAGDRIKVDRTFY